jgi:hypothetical protein
MMIVIRKKGKISRRQKERKIERGSLERNAIRWPRKAKKTEIGKQQERNKMKRMAKKKLQRKKE